MANPSSPDRHTQVDPAVSRQDRATYAAHLPAPLTRFIGRERQVRALIDLLQRPDVRLITLTGPSGVGKTRLAQHVSAQVADSFPDGLWFVSLALIRDADLVASTIAQSLNVRETGAHAIEDGIQTIVRNRRALLVLDNFEQVLTAGPLLTRLLSACPRLAILVTSRTVLNLSGEHDVTVPPLTVPSKEDRLTLDEVAVTDAVRLFCERAQAARDDFRLLPEHWPTVVAICARLDGLPLAIELAAAQVKVLPLPAMLMRLERRLPLLTGGRRDGPARQRTMRDAIGWSYDLLTDDEQALFRRLAVFAGGCTLEAAEYVAPVPCGLDLAVFDGIASLVAKSLLHQVQGSDGEPRYVMLQTVREYGLEQLAAHDEADEVSQAHAAYFLALVEQNPIESISSHADPRLGRLAVEHDNLRAALDWLLRSDSADDYLLLIGASAPYWYARGHVREGRFRLQQGLAIPGSVPTAAKGRVLTWAVQFAVTMVQFDEAVLLGEECLAVWDAVGDPRGRAGAIQAVAMVEEMQLHWAAAALHYDEAMEAWSELGERFHLARATALRGGVAFGQGNIPRAISLVTEAAEMFHQLGNHRWTALADWYLGMFLANDGQFAAAARHYRDSARTLFEAGDAVWLFKPLVGLAAIAVQHRLPESSARLLGAVDELLQRTGARLLPFDEPIYQQAESGARVALEETDYTVAHSAGGNMDGGDLLIEIDRVVFAAEAEGPRPKTKEPGDLSVRELQVLRLLTEGQSDREIADALCVSYRTVTSYVSSILNKLSVNSRTAAAAHAVRHGLV